MAQHPDTLAMRWAPAELVVLLVSRQVWGVIPAGRALGSGLGFRVQGLGFRV